MNPVSWVPPSPERMSDARARSALGSKFGLWKRLGTLAAKSDIAWHHFWRAAIDLIEEGHRPRDSRILERARTYAAEEAEAMRELEERNERRRNARRQSQAQDRPAE